jgi:hypothetical protein
VVTVQGVSASQAEKLKTHAEKSQTKILSNEYKDKEQSLCFRTAEESDANGLTSWLKANPLEGLDLKVAVSSETFSAYLRDKHKAEAAQIDKDQMGQNQFNLQNQYSMMLNMNMQLMNMYSNPQMQMMLYQMMANPYGQNAFGGFAGQKNNLFVRKAKTKDSSNGPAEQKRGSQQGSSSSARGNYRGDRDSGYTKKGPQDKPKQEKEKDESTRTRLDSDSFPPLSGPRKHIVSEPRAREREVVEGRVTRQYLVDYFVSHNGDIPMNENLKTLNPIQIPIIDTSGDPRIEELNPTQRREYYSSPYNPPSGPSSRKGSTNYRKGSFNQQGAGTKKRGTEDDEYVIKANDN